MEFGLGLVRTYLYMWSLVWGWCVPVHVEFGLGLVRTCTCGVWSGAGTYLNMWSLVWGWCNRADTGRRTPSASAHTWSRECTESGTDLVLSLNITCNYYDNSACCMATLGISQSCQDPYGGREGGREGDTYKSWEYVRIRICSCEQQ